MGQTVQKIVAGGGTPFEGKGGGEYFTYFGVSAKCAIKLKLFNGFQFVYC